MAVTGPDPKDRKFFRIMHRKEDRIWLKELYTLEVDGKAVPGEINPDGESFYRVVKKVGDSEYGCPYEMHGLALWLRLHRKPRGGKRPNAGRKKGGGKGRVQKSLSICLSQTEWDEFDRMRGEIRRGDFLRKLMGMWALQNL